MNSESELSLHLKEQISRFAGIVTYDDIITDILFRNSEELIEITQILPDYEGILPILLPTPFTYNNKRADSS
jgi:hypothetical protein